MVNVWESIVVPILELGTRGYPARIQFRLKIVNLLALLIFIVSLNYALVYALTDFTKYKLFVFLNLLLCCLALLVPLGHRISDIAGGLMVAGFEYVGLFALTALLGRDSGIQLNYVIGAAVPFLCFGFERMRLSLFVVLGGFILHLVAWFSFPPEAAIIAADAFLLSNIYISSAVTVFGLTAATVFHAFWLKEQAEAKTESLLRNMLPQAIADSLRDNPDKEIAQRIDSASILFADIVGFTGVAQDLGPERTVKFLNGLFTRFDAVADELKLEKIKTIGDCYMVVGGVPEPVTDHAVRVAMMAIRMHAIARDYASANAVEWNLRIGIACGPVLAGVIGRRKPVYDVWGDTVNLAARIEAAGEAGKTHVTEEFARQTAGICECERRGLISLRNFGPQETWYLLAVRASSARGLPNASGATLCSADSLIEEGVSSKPEG